MRPLWIVRATAMAVALGVTVQSADAVAESAAPLLPELPESAVLSPRADGFLARIGASRWQHWRTGPLRLVGEHVAVDAAWRPDSSAFVLLESSGGVKLVDVSRPTVERTLATPQPRAHAIAGFLPDGRRVLLATNAWESDRNVVVELDVTSGQTRSRLAFRRTPALAVPSPAKLDPTGHWLAVQRADVSPTVLQLWNLDSDELVDVACQHGKKLAWSRDGQRLAAECGSSLKLFAAADRFATAKIYLVPETGEPRFSPRGDRMWRVPDPIRGQRRATVMKTSSAHEAPEWNDGVLDWGEGNVQLVVREVAIALQDAASQRTIETAGVRVPIVARLRGTGAVRLAYATAEALLDLDRGQIVAAPKARLFDREGFVAISDRRTVMSLGAQRTMVKLPDDVTADEVLSVSPDGRFLVTGGSASATVIDRKSDLRTSVPIGDVLRVDWSPDGAMAYVAGAAKAAVWRAMPPAIVPVPLLRPLAAAWSQKGALVVGNAASLWWWQGNRSGQLALPRLRKKADSEDESPGRKIRFSADGSRVLVSSCGNRDFDDTVAFRVEGSGVRALGPAKPASCDQTWIGNERFVPATDASPSGRTLRTAIKAASKVDRLLFPDDEATGRVAIEQQDRILVVDVASQRTLREVTRPPGFRALGLFRGGALLVLTSEQAVKVTRVADGRTLDVYGVVPRADGHLDVWLFEAGERLGPDALAKFCAN